MRVDNLTEENFLDFALRAYTNYRCHGREEFEDDLLRINYFRRLIRKYKKTGEFEPRRLRLALNHLIVFYNVFRLSMATRMLFHECEEKLYPIIKTFLVHLNYMPAIVHGVNGQDILSKDIEVDENLEEQLRLV